MAWSNSQLSGWPQSGKETLGKSYYLQIDVRWFWDINPIFFSQATLVRNTTDENEARILYEYLAEASVVFPKVFPVMWVVSQ